jgi:hypothetical protein
MATSPRWHASL